jgi:hypothetical protein
LIVVCVAGIVSVGVCAEERIRPANQDRFL